MNKDLVLKNGDKVEYKEDKKIRKICINELEGWNINQFELDNMREVLKVERPTKYETIYEIKEILDEKEKEYLSYVIKPFRDRVRGIMKCVSSYKKEHWIIIQLENSEETHFPYFEPNTMYKGMEINKEYTLKELGL